MDEHISRTPAAKLAGVIGTLMRLKKELPEDSPLRAKANEEIETLRMFAPNEITIKENCVVHCIDASFWGMSTDPAVIRMAAIQAMYDERALMMAETPAALKANPDVWVTGEACFFAYYLLDHLEEFAAKVKEMEQCQAEDRRAWEEHLRKKGGSDDKRRD